MDWAYPLALLIPILAAPALWWFSRASDHPMSPRRHRWLLWVRVAMIVLVALAIASPALKLSSDQNAVIFVMDHSASQGKDGMTAAYTQLDRLAKGLGDDVFIGVISAGRSDVLIRKPGMQWQTIESDPSLLESDGAQTNYEAALDAARAMFPPDTTRRIVVIGDGLQTRGNLLRAAQQAAASKVAIDIVPQKGDASPDVRIVRLQPSQLRSHEGATISVFAELESSMSGEGMVHLFENGVEIESKPVKFEKAGEKKVVVFRCTPDQRQHYRYVARISGFDSDKYTQNNTATALVDVQGKPKILYIEGEEGKDGTLRTAMAREGINLEVGTPNRIQSLDNIRGFDAIILSDVSAKVLGEQAMRVIRNYVKDYGGGFIMIGGVNSFGVGGYYQTPIEEILPVKIKAPDKEEKHSVALALVLDRSGSMSSGGKMELCKSAASGTVELLSQKDFVGVYAFDSRSRAVVPMKRVKNRKAIQSQIQTISPGGGTNIRPGMDQGWQALQRVKAKVKHMIVLSDGQTSGSGYQQLAAQIKNQNITISTVAVGRGAQSTLLKQVAEAGGGKFYYTDNAADLPRIFTEDTKVHVKKMIREVSFKPVMSEPDPMLKGWQADSAQHLFGYVKTHRRELTKVPLVTDQDDPLLAHWRFDLGRVTAFTSDCKSRWSELWITQWAGGYSQFWGQVIRETARQPQSRNMELSVIDTGRERQALIETRVWKDAAEPENKAIVNAEVRFVPADALDQSERLIDEIQLHHTGSGKYTGNFNPEKPGVYLVTAKHGKDRISAGLVRRISNEVATGEVDESLFETVSSMTGGKILSASDDLISFDNASRFVKLIELRPYILILALFLFLVDIVIRRWENVLGFAEVLGVKIKK